MSFRHLDRPTSALQLATRMLRLALVALPLGCQSASDAGGDTESNPGAAGAASSGANDPRALGEATSSPSTDGATRNAAAGAAAESAADTPNAAEPATDEAGAAGGPNAAGPAAPPAPAQAFEACAKSRGAYDDCDTIYVTMTEDAPPRCVQLTIDNCGSYSRQGLSADVPNPWRLASGSIAPSASPCELGVFNPASSSIAQASGSITWDETTTLPTELVLDLTLEPSSATEDTAGISVATTAPLRPTDCEQ